jgi:MFS family permease
MGKSALSRVPLPVWTLGFVSMLMDVSSELIHSLLPLFLVTVLGTSTFAVGIIEGIAEASAMVVKVFSGYLSDYFRNRKVLTVLGYGLAAVTKPIFPLASSLAWIVVARLVDRVGKGIRGAPRDALIADITPLDARGAAYGLRQALDTLGAVLGPLLAVGAMLYFANNFKLVFWLAVLPALASVALLVLGVREPEHRPDAKTGASPIALADFRRLPAPYWWVVAIAAVMTLARFSEAFLILRAQDVGMTLASVPLVMVLMSIAYALVSYPAGVFSDRGHQRRLLAGGLVALIAADLVLARAATVGEVILGAAVWGVHMGLTQSVFAAMVAEAAPPDLRGTAFGVFNLLCGVALLIASALAGWLWDAFGPSPTFYGGAAFTAFALIGLSLQRRTGGRAAAS